MLADLRKQNAAPDAQPQELLEMRLSYTET